MRSEEEIRRRKDEITKLLIHMRLGAPNDSTAGLTRVVVAQVEYICLSWVLGESDADAVSGFDDV